MDFKEPIEISSTNLFCKNLFEPITYLILSIILFVMYRIWIEGKQFPHTKHHANGKVIIVTGANTGIGKETALGLAERGACVILACRNKEKAIQACTEIIEKTKNSQVYYMHLDLSSLNSVRKFVKEFTSEYDRLDVLINNAGVMGMPFELTEDGLEMHMATNHYGHFLLTVLLLPLLKQSLPSRIVTVSSTAHEWVKFRKDDLSREKSYNRFEAYGQSKLANILFTKELALRLKDSGVTANVLHPGTIYTDIPRNMHSFCFIFNMTVCNIFCKLFLKSTKAGAQTTLFAALDFNIQTVSGVYFKEMTLAQYGKSAQNDEDAKWLWKHSEEITGITL